MDKMTARGLDAEGLADGQYVIDVASGKVTGWVPAPAAGVESITAGTGVAVDSTDPAHPVISASISPLLPLTSKPSGGDPAMTFGGPNDDEPIFMEGPL